ncbi:hypothetical protein ACL07V_37350 [Streptomyces sp. MB22_4]|uniref:hypothetical protein n=1 Tax=Streptomyces sp. MB22_4 TaxID=3383120 RepID=UPI0039A1A846
MIGNIGRQTVTLLDAPLVDGDYNTQVRDWDHPTQTPVSGCTVDYLFASRSKQAGDQTITRAQLFLPRGAPKVLPQHRVQWDGRTWDVDGVPADVQSSGPLDGQSVTLLEVKGA